MSAVTPDHDRALGFLVSDVSRLLRREFDRRVRHLGLTRAQWLLLTHINRQPGARPTDLAESLQQQKITVSRQAARLERAGWLKREDDRHDRRAQRLLLTRKAERMVARLGVVAEGLLAEAARGLSGARQEALVRDLQRIKRNLVTMGAQGASTELS